MRIVRRGSRGESVKALQRALAAHGFGPLVPDGIFGKGTRAAVLQFQASEGLDVDGIVGPASWRALLQGPGKPQTAPRPTDAKAQLRGQIVKLPLGVRRDVLLAAVVDLGKNEVPLGSNGGPQIAHLVNGYREFWGIESSSMPPWCGIAVSSWIAIGLKLGSPFSARTTVWSEHPFGTWQGSVRGLEDWAKTHGKDRRLRDAKPGDVFTMGRGGSGSDPSTSLRAGHTGLIVEYRNGKVLTIEGNASNGVRSRLRRADTLRMAVDWT